MSSQIREGNLKKETWKISVGENLRKRHRMRDFMTKEIWLLAKLLHGISASICVCLAKRPIVAWNWHLLPYASSFSK